MLSKDCPHAVEIETTNAIMSIEVIFIVLYCAQRFAYGLWRFRSTFPSPETKAGYGAKTLLAAIHPP
jgi:hypothetical protein